MSNRAIKKLKEVFDETIESEVKCNTPIEQIDYSKLFVKAGENNTLFTFFGYDLYTFNYTYKDKDCILMIFRMPINSIEFTSKGIAEKIMDLVNIIENCFVITQYLRVSEKEDKFIYLTVIKEVEGVEA
jgi:hypothetical protein